MNRKNELDRIEDLTASIRQNLENLDLGGREKLVQAVRAAATDRKLLISDIEKSLLAEYVSGEIPFSSFEAFLHKKKLYPLPNK